MKGELTNTPAARRFLLSFHMEDVDRKVPVQWLMLCIYTLPHYRSQRSQCASVCRVYVLSARPRLVYLLVSGLLMTHDASVKLTPTLTLTLLDRERPHVCFYV